MDASESRLLLAGAFQSLDDTDRRILYLRFVRELSRREVADELGFSQSALARRTKAALAKVRAELEGNAFKSGAKPQPELAGRGEIRARRGAGAESKAAAAHSGRLMLRMPQSLHTELARAAEREEVSLNQYITNTLAASMRWHAESESAPRAAALAARRARDEHRRGGHRRRDRAGVADRRLAAGLVTGSSFGRTPRSPVWPT